MTEPRKVIPDNAKLVFKGVLFEVWQWEQEMFDGSTATFERLKRPDAVTVIPVVGDSILIEHQEQPARAPFISPPGGRVDEGEDPLAAAKRELHEETGYDSDDWILWNEFRPYSTVEFTNYLYIARNCKKNAEAHLDAGERIETRLISFDDFLMLSEELRFRGWETVNMLLRLRLNPEAKEGFRKLLFGS